MARSSNLWTSIPLLLCLAPAGCKGKQQAIGKPDPPPRTPDTKPAPAPAQPELTHRQFLTAGEALQALLKEHRPRVLGLGEFHQNKATVKVRSATRRFSESMVPVLGRHASDLVVETWITEGKCGKQEKRVVKNVEKTTQRPQTTESEIITMLRRAKGLGIQPHILKAGCKDYKKIMGADGKVDYVQLLGFITRALRQKTESILEARANTKPGRPALQKRELVVIYGGALHNDLFPYEDLKSFSFAAQLKQRTGGRYLELDLYVPEYVAGDETLSKERWYPLFERLASPQKVLLIRRGEGSYILVLKKGVARKIRPPAGSQK